MSTRKNWVEQSSLAARQPTLTPAPAPGSLMPRDFAATSYRSPYVADAKSYRMGLTPAQLDQRDRAHAASYRNAPYLAIPPAAGAALASPVAAGAALRAAAPVVEAGLAEANKEAARRVIQHVVRRGYDVSRSAARKGADGYRFKPAGQTWDKASEVVRLMPGKKKAAFESQRKLYLTQSRGDKMLDLQGAARPKATAEAHMPAWQWIRKELFRSGAKRK